MDRFILFDCFVDRSLTTRNNESRVAVARTSGVFSLPKMTEFSLMHWRLPSPRCGRRADEFSAGG